MKDFELPEGMIACGSIPHSWLFRQGLFVIHHSGFGTTASAFTYEIPSILIPHILDQSGFAKQLYGAGVATKPIKAKNLTEEIHIKAIQEMTNNYDEKKKISCELSEKIRKEGGVKEAAMLIKKSHELIFINFFHNLVDMKIILKDSFYKT